MEDIKGKERIKNFMKIPQQDPILNRANYMVSLRKKQKYKLFNEKRFRRKHIAEINEHCKEDIEIVNTRKESNEVMGFRNCFLQMSRIESLSEENLDELYICLLLSQAYIND